MKVNPVGINAYQHLDNKKNADTLEAQQPQTKENVAVAPQDEPSVGCEKSITDGSSVRIFCTIVRRPICSVAPWMSR